LALIVAGDDDPFENGIGGSVLIIQRSQLVIQLIAEPEIESQPGMELPIVLEKEVFVIEILDPEDT
jgi:hypothetical protein